MIIVIADATAKSDQADTLAPLLAKAASASRQDPGCLSYVFTRDVEEGTRFHSIETWDSKASLDAHMAAPATRELLGALPDLVAEQPVITVHDVSSSAPYS